MGSHDSETDPKTFEQRTAELLALTGLDIAREQLVGHKKVDLVGYETRRGKNRVIAIECKSQASPLTQAEVSGIYANYLPLWQKGYVDEILLVTRSGLAPSALTMIGETRDFSHQMLADIESRLLDFRTYLRALIEQYESDGLSSYYVPVRTSEGEDLEQAVHEWIKSPGNQPLAILAGYGMGKTSFARHLAAVLVDKARILPELRIPIYVRLGDISAEQSLEGLLGKALTANTIVHGYSFEGFMRLARSGRFVILLDGFDEMKQALSWEEFRFNFKELNRLVVGDSKVILLGRPTAFLTDEEHFQALRGIRLVKGNEFRDPDWPQYREISLAPFEKEQISSFLERYLTYKNQGDYNRSNTPQRSARILSKISRLSDKQIDDIARRPVQLKMLAEVLPQWKGAIDALTTTIVYSLFIDLIIEREQEKVSRRRFGKKQRRAFAGKLAWWLWNTRKATSLSTKDIPEDILSLFARGGDDLDAVRRDLVAACFLERKLGDALYFPHRSFQEYLVAEEIVELLATGAITFAAAAEACTNEVAGFIESIVGLESLRKWERALEQHQGTIPWCLARVWLRNYYGDSYDDYLRDRVKRSSSPWYVLLLSLWAIGHGRTNLTFVIQLVESKRSKSTDPAYILICHLCLLLLIGSFDPRGVGVDTLAIVRRSLIDVCYATFRFCNAGWGDGLSHDEKADRISSLPISDSRYRKADPELTRFLRRTSLDRKKAILDLRATHRALCGSLREYCLISEWVAGDTLKIAGHDMTEKITYRGRARWITGNIPGRRANGDHESDDSLFEFLRRAQDCLKHKS